MFLALKIIMFELVAETSLNYDQNMPKVVNVLKNSPKISDLTKTDLFQLNLSEING